MVKEGQEQLAGKIRTESLHRVWENPGPLRIWEDRGSRQQQTVCNMCKELWIAVNAEPPPLHGGKENIYDFMACTVLNVRKKRIPLGGFTILKSVCYSYSSSAFRHVFDIHCEINKFINLSIVCTFTWGSLCLLIVDLAHRNLCHYKTMNGWRGNILAVTEVYRELIL